MQPEKELTNFEKIEEVKPVNNKENFTRVSGFRVWKNKQYVLVKDKNGVVKRLYTEKMQDEYILDKKEVKELGNA